MPSRREKSINARTPRAPTAAPERHHVRQGWARLGDQRLLDLRFCDLDLQIPGTLLEHRVEQLYKELSARDVRFRPHCWLSTEWFSPTGIPGVALPFYLAHPRLARLEDTMMLEVEGGSNRWCMQLLRHEAGHAFETAYRLGRRPKWRKRFGRASKPYPELYRPRPISRNYVLHLEWWYAQSHPCEDFAETFAVWLAGGAWRRQYKGWPALKKLQYVDELMGEIGGRPALTQNRDVYEPLSEITMTLREHYDSRRERYESRYPAIYDRELRRLFPTPPNPEHAPAAAAYLRHFAPHLRRLVARWTRESSYTVDLVLRDMIKRSRELDLRASGTEADLKLETLVMLTVQVMNFVYGTEHEVAV